MSCPSCSELDEVLSNVMNMINSPKLTLTDEQQSQVTVDATHAVETIANWKAHMLRTVNKKQAKQETLGALNDQSVLIIMDWAMKYLPQRYREQISRFLRKARKKLACCLRCFQNWGEQIQC